MSGGPRIAIDGMGGDAGPAVMIAGADRALRKDPALRFAFYGDEQLIGAELDRFAKLKPKVEIVHSPEAIASSEKPTQAIRRARAILRRRENEAARPTSSCSTSGPTPNATHRTSFSSR